MPADGGGVRGFIVHDRFEDRWALRPGIRVFRKVSVATHSMCLCETKFSGFRLMTLWRLQGMVNQFYIGSAEMSLYGKCLITSGMGRT
jgi:hypothetical protein